MNACNSRSLAVAAIAVSAAVASSLPAFADLTIVQTTKISAPGVQQMLSQIPEQQKASLGGMLSPMLTGTPWLTTTYLQGSRVRTDMGQSAVVANGVSGQQFTLDKATHKFSLGAYDPFQKVAGSFGFQITPTGVTTTMLGHTVQKYAIAMTSSVLSKSAISGELWAAPDLPAPPASKFASGSVAAGFGAQMAKVRGLPLAYTLTYSGTPMGDYSVSSMPTSISENPLSASVFRIPSDYSQGAVQTGQQMPSAGFPLGDGMPLDMGSASGLASSALGLNSGVDANSGGVDASALSSGSVQQLLGSLGGLLGSLAGSSLGGNTGAASTPSAGATGIDTSSLGNLISPQMIQQMTSQLQSLLGSDDSSGN